MLQSFSPYNKNSKKTTKKTQQKTKHEPISKKSRITEQRVFQQGQPKERIRQQLPSKATSRTYIVVAQDIKFSSKRSQ